MRILFVHSLLLTRIGSRFLAFLLGIALLTGSTYGQFALDVGGTQSDTGRVIALDSAGNSYVSGRYRLTIDLDPGAGVHTVTSASSFSRYIASYDSSGGLRFGFSLPGAGSLDDCGLAIDGSNNLYVTGSFSGTADFDPGVDESFLSSLDGPLFVASYDSSGNFRFAFNFALDTPSIAEVSSGIAVDPGGTIYITGAFTGLADFDPTEEEFFLQAIGNSDPFVASFSSGGALRFAFPLTGDLTGVGRAIAIDSVGNSFVSGSFFGDTDFDPSAGSDVLTSLGDEDLFLASYNASGLLRYAMSAGSSGQERALAVAVDDSGNAFVTGYFNGTIDLDPSASQALLTSNGGPDLFLASYAPSGARRFSFGVGGISGDFGNDLVLDLAGNVHVTGAFATQVDFDPGPGSQLLNSLGSGALVASYSSTGDYRNAYAISRVGNIGTATGSGIDLDSEGRAHVIGTFSGTIDADPGDAQTLLSSAGSGDMFVSSFTVLPPIFGPGSIPLRRSESTSQRDQGYSNWIGARAVPQPVSTTAFSKEFLEAGTVTRHSCAPTRLEI